MIDPVSLMTKVAIAALSPALKAVQSEMARQNVEAGIIDFGNLDSEMDEAIDVLARDHDKPGKMLLDYVKGIISGRPPIFSEPVAQQWIRTERAQDLIKSGVRALIKNRPLQEIAEEAANFYASFEEMASEHDGYIVYDYAVAFVSVSITRFFSPGEKATLSAIADLATRFDAMAAPSSLSRELLDDAIAKEVARIRQGRFFAAFETPMEARILAQRLMVGNLIQGSDTARSSAIAQCARWLCNKDNPDNIDELLTAANSLARTDEYTIAEAFKVARNDWKLGLAVLNPRAVSAHCTAALQIMLIYQGPSKAIDWFNSAGFTPANLDSDGRYVLLNSKLQKGDWDDAYNEAVAVSEQDFLMTPVLQHAVAMARIARVVPEDLRATILQGMPFDARSFPFADGAQAMADRREAIRLLHAAERSAMELGCVTAARQIDNRILMLELVDPATETAAKAKLETLLSDGDQAITFIPLGLSFDVPMDLDTIERTLSQNTALQPPYGSFDIGFARLAIAINQPNAIEAANYFERHREVILHHLDYVNTIRFEVPLLVAAGRPEQARGCIANANERLPSEELERLEQLIQQGASGPTTVDLETAYAGNPSTINLAKLVAHLSQQGYSARFYELAHRLVMTTRTRTDAEQVARFLSKYDRFDELAKILDDILEIVKESPDLRCALAWGRYRQGRFNEAKELVDALREERDDSNDRALFVNILIGTGRWPELASFVEHEWARRDCRTAEELLGLAQLAAQVNYQRFDGLLAEAAAMADDNPNILAGCYLTAVRAGREDSLQVYQWFERAVVLSGDDGPIQTASLEQLADQIPNWDHHVENVWNKLIRGEVPLSLAAQMLRQSSLEFRLSRMISNRQQADPRMRAVIPAFTGARSGSAMDVERIALDGSALVTLGMLNLVGTVVNRKGGISIPHCTMSWLFGERQKLGFHQPSRIKAAHQLTRALAGKRLHRFATGLAPTPRLEALVGYQLALMIETAMVRPEDAPQRLVVRSSPVHKIGSLRGEVVALDEFHSVLCSCSAVIDKLVLRGQLTREEEDRARRYLLQHEERWPNEVAIEDGAFLYLDDLSISLLRTSGVLERLHAAGLVAYVSEREISEAEALIDLESQAEAIEEVVERIRAPLAAGIEQGAISIDRIFTGEELKAHPDIAVIQLADSVDAVVTDDRFMNRSLQLQGQFKSSMIFSTLDLLASLRSDEAFSDNQYWGFRTVLRQSGLIHFPSSEEELIALVSQSSTSNKQMVETAELKAFRENLALAQMRGWLTLPLEAYWLNKLCGDVVRAIRAQWNEQIPDEDARARSTWLLAQADTRNWVAGATDYDAINIARYGFVLSVNSLLLTHIGHMPGDSASRLANWLQEDVVGTIKFEEPAIYDWLLENLRNVLIGHRNSDEVIDAE